MYLSKLWSVSIILKEGAPLFNMCQSTLMPHIENIDENASERERARIKQHLTSIYLWYFNTKLMHFSSKNLEIANL